MPDKRVILDSWKAISAYLGWSEKTCRDREIHGGLPVRRTSNAPKARVFAYADELDSWLAARPSLADAGGEPERGGKAPAARRILIVSAAMAIVAIAVAYFVLVPHGMPEPPPPPGSVVVLPFDNMDQGERSEALADGMTETLINALGRVPGLRVTGRSSAFYWKGKGRDPSAIGRRLRVRTVLESSVQVSGDRIRVRSQLFDAATGYVLWSRVFDRVLADVFAVQDDIARAIVGAVKTEGLDEHSVPYVRGGTADMEAYNLCLLGRYFWNKRSRAELDKAKAYFEQALIRDGGYAQAYAGLADVYLILGNNMLLEPREAYPRTRELARRALEIDVGLADAYTTLSAVEEDFDWDYAGAEGSIKKALALNPGSSFAHQLFAVYLSYQGRHDEAVTEIRIAREIDPLSPRIGANVGVLLHYAGKNDQAVEELNQALEFEPRHAATYEGLGDAERERGDLGESIRWFEQARALDDQPTFSIKKAVSLARAGKEAEARKIEAAVIARSEREYVSRVLMGALYEALGDRERAFAWLDRAIVERDSRVPSLKVDPLFRSLRSVPRFQEILAKAGLDR